MYVGVLKSIPIIMGKMIKAPNIAQADLVKEAGLAPDRNDVGLDADADLLEGQHDPLRLGRLGQRRRRGEQRQEQRHEQRHEQPEQRQQPPCPMGRLAAMATDAPAIPLQACGGI